MKTKVYAVTASDFGGRRTLALCATYERAILYISVNAEWISKRSVKIIAKSIDAEEVKARLNGPLTIHRGGRDKMKDSTVTLCKILT